MEELKYGLYRVGGVGSGGFWGEETGKRDEKRDEGLGTRIVCVGDWTVVIGASHLRLLLFCAANGK